MPNTVGEHIMNAKWYEEQNNVLQVNEYNLMKWVILTKHNKVSKWTSFQKRNKIELGNNIKLNLEHEQGI